MGSIEDPSVHDPREDAPKPEAPASAEAGGDNAVSAGAPDHLAAKDVSNEAGAKQEGQPAVPASTRPEPSSPSNDAHRAPEPKRTGHPIRDRLLAKAMTAGTEDPHRPTTDSTGLGAVENELLKIASSRKPVRLSRGMAGAPLSSASVMLLGTVFGLGGFALVFALLFEFLPRGPREDTATTTPTQTAAVGTAQVVPVVASPPPRKRMPGPWRIEQAKPGERVLRGKIGKEPFLKAIQDAGLQKTQAYRVYTALKEEKDLDRCRPGDEFVALLDRTDGKVLAFEYIVGREEVYQARQGADGLLVGKALDLSVRRARVQGGITIARPSFADNANAAHFDPGLAVIINRALEGHLTVDDFKLGDRLRVVAQEVTVLGEFSRYAGLEALEYMPVSGDPIRVYYFENNRRYYDARGRAPGEAGWRRPVPGAPITSRFNPKRLHPILKKVMPHNGTDFGAPAGTPIFAASSGKIVKLGDYGANGNFIAIEHRNGYETGYSHLLRFEPGLKVGDAVKRLQPIGYVGSTGRSTGPHLHFSAKKDGKFIDPESLGLDRLTTLPPDQLALFQKVKVKYDELLVSVELPPAITPPPPASAGETHYDEFGAEEGSAALAPDVAPDPAEPGPVEALALPEHPAPVETRPSEPGAPPGVPRPLPAPVAPGRSGSALYMTDQELLEAQSASDDGEVEE
jgi:murein DD-endopeptidase MepM/ murein hydrolase activator NlpD